jgi:hypothetical protein
MSNEAKRVKEQLDRVLVRAIETARKVVEESERLVRESKVLPLQPHRASSDAPA